MGHRVVTASLSALAGALVLAAPSPARTVPVHVYFLHGERAALVHRAAPARTPATAAVRALLRGPTAAERARGFTSAVPAGTALRGLTVRSGVATVDLTRRFESGGGTASMQARLAQLVYTLTAVRGVDRVVLHLSGFPVRVFSGEGLILDQPLTRRSVRTFDF